MKAPVIFPYFGGKRRVSHHIWQALGHCDNYIEPFFGSGAVLFNRPQDCIPWPPKGETINDLDGYIVNVWRSIQADPDGVVAEIERLGPAQELTLHAVNAELIAKREGFSERMRGDRRAFDAELAACWVWGACQWIGQRWAEQSKAGASPHLGDFGKGIQSQSLRGDLHAPITWLSRRLRHVRMLCGDWSRCVTDSAMTKFRHGAIQGIMLDPPYRAGNDTDLYSCESDVSLDVAEWCRERGADPRLRIVLCGLAGEHSMPSGWRYLDAQVLTAASRGKSPRVDRLLFSPHCLPVDGEQAVDPSQPVRRRQRNIYDLLDPTTTAPAPIATDTQQDNHGPDERP